MADDDFNFEFESQLERKALPSTQIDERVLAAIPPQEMIGQQPGNYRRNFKKTVCTYWIKGMCMKGDSCGFLHQYDVEKMPICRNLLKYGECKDFDCPYKHDTEEIKECNMYRLGFCIYGPQCRFRHRTLPGPPPPLEGLEAAKPKEFRNINAVVNAVNPGVIEDTRGRRRPLELEGPDSKKPRALTWNGEGSQPSGQPLPLPLPPAPGVAPPRPPPGPPPPGQQQAPTQQPHQQGHTSQQGNKQSSGSNHGHHGPRPPPGAPPTGFPGDVNGHSNQQQSGQQGVSHQQQQQQAQQGPSMPGMMAQHTLQQQQRQQQQHMQGSGGGPCMQPPAGPRPPPGPPPPGMPPLNPMQFASNQMGNAPGQHMAAGGMGGQMGGNAMGLMQAGPMGMMNPGMMGGMGGNPMMSQMMGMMNSGMMNPMMAQGMMQPGMMQPGMMGMQNQTGNFQ